MSLTYPFSKYLRALRVMMVHVVLAVLLFTGLSAQAQYLETYIEEAFANSPSIKAVETQHEIATERITEAKSFPNTDFSGGYMVGKGDMPMMWNAELSVMQMFPWFGTISARSSYAEAKADANLVDIEIEKKRMAMALSQSYFRLYEVAKKQQVLDANVTLLQKYEQMALTSVEVGKASAVSVLRLQMRQNSLMEQKQILGQDYLAELVAFNKMLNRAEVADIQLPDSLLLPEQDEEIEWSQLNLHPELVKYEELNRAVSQADALNKKERAPQFGVGLEYMLYTAAPDMFMPMASISIPIFNKKYKSIARQNKLRHQELGLQKQAIQNSLTAELQRAVKQRNAARIRYETQEQNLRQAQDATDILFKNYETGSIDFKEVLDVQELQLSIQLNQIEAVGEYYEQLSTIEYYLTEE